jgi:hypothetical protein
VFNWLDAPGVNQNGLTSTGVTQTADDLASGTGDKKSPAFAARFGCDHRGEHFVGSFHGGTPSF